MAASKKSSALQIAKSKLQETKKTLMAQKKESQQTIKALKYEMKSNVSEAMLKGYEKGVMEATKESDKYMQDREKAINSALVKFNKQFKSKVAKPKKSAAKKAPAKKVVAKKAPAKKVTAKKAAAKKK